MGVKGLSLLKSVVGNTLCEITLQPMQSWTEAVLEIQLKSQHLFPCSPEHLPGCFSVSGVDGWGIGAQAAFVRGAAGNNEEYFESILKSMFTLFQARWDCSKPPP